MKLVIALSVLSVVVTGILLVMNVFAMVATYGGPTTTIVYATWLLITFLAATHAYSDWAS